MSSQPIIAHYRITGKLGEGGMGEVWRATDSKLNREVAIKVLPDAFASDPGRMARFTREAQVLASLNHPNIAAIYGAEDRALIMELVDGPTLAERIAHGPIPLAEALDIARQIADALEAAHEKGVVHRDLKPANIKVRPDGTVKVLDFGLAKMVEEAGVASSEVSPTVTIGATRAGTIMGTAAYMSPEQARGKPVDRRADIWALGVVLYEMLTGRRLFEGETVSDTLAGVIKGEPDLSVLPARVRMAVARCLSKDPRNRWGSAGDARWALAAGEVSGPLAPQHRFRRPAWAAAIAALAVTLGALAWVQFREMPAQVLLRATILPPENTTLDFTNGLGLPALSPDGRRIVFGARSADGKSPLWVRFLDGLTAQPLAGTDGATFPFWSPDSRFIAFFADGKLKKIDASGGEAIVLANAPQNTARGGTWNRDGIIVYAPRASGSGMGPLERMAAAGGPSTPLPKALGRMPWFLPDGNHFLCFVVKGARAEIHVGALDGGESQVIGVADSNAVYVHGHLLFVHEGVLMAQPFNTGRLVTTGEAVAIAGDIQTVLNSGTVGVFSVSETGLLVYRSSGADAAGPQSQLIWFDRSGKAVGTAGEPGGYDAVALSSDGTRVATDRADLHGSVGNRDPMSRGQDIWLLEFARGTSTRFTTDPAPDALPIWSPDGSRIVFTSGRDGGGFNLYEKVSSGASNEEPLLRSAESKWPQDWSPDGRFLLYASVNGARSDLWMLPMTGEERKPRPYLQTEFNEGQARFSPDGHWVAYTSNESGRNEVYARPFPDSRSGKSIVSNGGGSQPRWRRDGKELFYISADSQMMAVEVSTNPVFQSSIATALFAVSIIGGSTTSNMTARYDVTADGNRFLVNVPQGPAREPGDAAAKAPTPITVVLNWSAGLKK